MKARISMLKYNMKTLTLHVIQTQADLRFITCNYQSNQPYDCTFSQDPIVFNVQVHIKAVTPNIGFG